MTARRLAAALLLSAGLSACSSADEASGSGASRDGPIVEVENEPQLGVSWESYRDAALAAGGGRFYVVEWDRVFETEAGLREHFEQIAVREEPKLAVFKQISTGFEPTFDASQAVDIVYCVSNSFSNKTNVVSDIAAATSSWQSVVNVTFRYDSSQDGSCAPSNANVHFAVLPVSGVGLIACGTSKMVWSPNFCPYGSGGAFSAVGVLSIDYSRTLDPGLTFAGVLRHELGHILGFRHEHPWAPSPVCPEPISDAATDVTGRRLNTTSSDPVAYDVHSVMHYPKCGGITGVDFAISDLDGSGAREVYGMPIAWHVAEFPFGE